MRKDQLEILENAFSAEIMGFPLQTRSKLADELVESGHLYKAAHVEKGVFIKGFGLTLRGHMAYCQSCAGVEVPE